MKVGIAGLGGIGSNVARHLVQAGVGELKIIDFDTVEAVNLNRQFYTVDQIGCKKTESLAKNLQAISPIIKVESIDMRIKPGDAATLFSDCNIVVEGVDEIECKTMLINELAETGQTVVSASGIAGPDMRSVRVRRVGHCHVVGDFVSDEKEYALFPPKIALVAALMAGIVLEDSYSE